MPTHIYQPVVVIGVNNEIGPQEIVDAHSRAQSLFEDGLVSELTPIGHNFIQSFCVFPSGSSEGREAQLSHKRAVKEFCQWLETTNLEFVGLNWREREMPEVIYTEDGPVTDSSPSIGR